jgi:hypothetical protein
MEHPLIAVVAPLFELNPARYAFSPGYRASARARLGRRAGRLFAYQLAMAALGLAATLLVLALLVGGPGS